MSNQFKQGFQDEARELLSELESALLELDEKRDDPETIGRAFRALHTIKGSGAMFGFDDIAAFAHKLEAVFDQLRKGQLAATTDLINLSLAAGDQIRIMLDASTGLAAVDQDRAGWCTTSVAPAGRCHGVPLSALSIAVCRSMASRRRISPDSALSSRPNRVSAWVPRRRPCWRSG